MSPFPNSLNKLCAPAMIYFTISMVVYAILLIQNIGSEDIYCAGCFQCNVFSKLVIFIVKLVYILFWTWVLNLICKDGHPIISWLLVLFPLLLFFVLIGVLLTFSM